MFCKHCGSPLLEGALFCSNCGERISYIDEETVTPTIAEEAPVAEEAPAYSVPEEETRVDPVNIFKKRRFPIAVVAAACAVLMLLAAFITVSLVSGGSNRDATAIMAHEDEDGVAYIPLMNGKSIVINGDVTFASITPDRKHFLFLMDDGALYFSKTKSEEKTKVCDNCDYAYDLKNDGFFFRDEDGYDYRLLFDDPTPLKLGEHVTVITALDTTSALYTKQDSDGIYTLAHDSNEPQKVGTADDTPVLEAISNDARLAVWVVEDNYSHTIMLSENGNRTTLGEVDSMYNYTYVNFTKDQSAAVVTNGYSNYMWIVRPGEDVLKVKLGADIYDGSVYTENGQLSDYKNSKFSTVYVATEGEEGANLYSVSSDGDRERILSDAHGYCIVNKTVIYTDEDSNLYQAALDESEVSNESKIAGDVEFFTVSQNGKFVYYWKDCDEDTFTGTLYCYKLGDKDPQKIGSDVFFGPYAMYGLPALTLSANGKTVFYFKDAEEIESQYNQYGTLMKWNYGDDSGERIASEVICYSPGSGLRNRIIDPSGFMYMKYQTLTKDGAVLANWMYCKGNHSEKVAADVFQ